MYIILTFDVFFFKIVVDTFDLAKKHMKRQKCLSVVKCRGIQKLAAVNSRGKSRQLTAVGSLFP